MFSTEGMSPEVIKEMVEDWEQCQTLSQKLAAQIGPEVKLVNVIISSLMMVHSAAETVGMSRETLLKTIEITLKAFDESREGAGSANSQDGVPDV